MLFRLLVLVSFSFWSHLCSAQIKYLDTTALYFTFQGHILDTFELKTNVENINKKLMSLHVQGNYLECILENHTDSIYHLFNSCGQLKVFIEFKGTERIEYPSGCDYDNNNYRTMHPKIGFNIYIPKSPHWKNMEVRACLFINEKKYHSNWIRYD
jgi:hypothetical protein